MISIRDVDINPVTLDDARNTITNLLYMLIETQGIALMRGDELIRLKEKLDDPA